MHDDFIESFFQSLAETITCAWCRHPWKTTLTAGLCSHCYRIKRQIRRLDREIEKAGLTRELESHYKVALRKAQLARSEGSCYGNIHRKDISALDLEHEFDELSKHFLNKKIFYGDATSIGWGLPPPQRMYVFYLLSLIMREYFRRNRGRLAAFDITGMSLDEVKALEN